MHLRKIFKKLLFPTKILCRNKHIYGGLHSKNFCHLIGFQTNVFLNPYGMSFHAVAIFSLELTTLLDSFWAHCVMLLLTLRHFWKKSWNDFLIAPKEKLFSHKNFENPCSRKKVPNWHLSKNSHHDSMIVGYFSKGANLALFSYCIDFQNFCG